MRHNFLQKAWSDRDSVCSVVYIGRSKNVHRQEKKPKTTDRPVLSSEGDQELESILLIVDRIWK
jgi:hypothetical protein